MTLRVKYNKKKDSYMIEKRTMFFFWAHIPQVEFDGTGFGYDKWWFDDRKIAEDNMLKMLFKHNERTSKQKQLLKEEKKSPIKLSTKELRAKFPELFV